MNVNKPIRITDKTRRRLHKVVSSMKQRGESGYTLNDAIVDALDDSNRLTKLVIEKNYESKGYR